MYNDNTVPLHNESGKKGLKSKRNLLGILLVVILIVAAAVVIPVVLLKVKKDDKDGRKSVPPAPSTPFPPDLSCTVVDAKVPNNGSGPAGPVNVSKKMVLSGLDVPWQLAYVPGSTLMFVTERAGKLSQFDAAVEGSLKLLANVPNVAPANYTAEGGLLGLAYVDSPVPYIFMYLTSGEGGKYRNRVERWTYDKTAGTVKSDKVIIDDIPSARENNGGFLLIQGGFLYISTGDASEPARAQDTSSLAGKILRINIDGSIPPDNPFNNPVFIYGLRNPAGFSFLDMETLIIADHGVGGVEKGGDRVIVGKKGSNLGWGITINCETNRVGEAAIVAPRLVYGVINPPGGILVYNASSTQEPENTIPAWQGHVLLTSLRGRHLQDVKLSGTPAYNFLENYVYFLGSVMNGGGMGRLRSIVLNDRNGLFVGTSNCDSRGTDVGLCKNGTRDAIYKISTPSA